ncbi:MAG: thioredoxin family protein [Thaumarchaeota archaeon]|nr:thioredoxin family protein [Nitrososphaerota archaeon]
MVKTSSSQTLQAGQKAPNFNLKGVDGKVYSLNDFNNDLLLVVFICNHCPYVHARLDDIIALQEKYKDNLCVVGINSNDSNYEGEGFENMVKYTKERKMNFPYLIDETQNIARAYGAVCTPDPFLFDSDKKLVFHGRINEAVEPEQTPKTPVMEINIKKVLNGESIEKIFDPSIGCSIKWKN